MNCIRIGFPGKQILGKRKGLQEVLLSSKQSLRIHFPGSPIFIQLPPGWPRRSSTTLRGSPSPPLHHHAVLFILHSAREVLQSWPKKLALGCVISPLRHQAESNNLGQFFLANSVHSVKLDLGITYRVTMKALAPEILYWACFRQV